MPECRLLSVSAHPLDAADGPGLHIRAVARELAKLGVEVTLLGPTHGPFALEGVQIEAMKPAGGRKQRAALAKRTGELLADSKRDVVYTRGSLRAVAEAAEAAKTPLVVEYNGVLLDEAQDAGFLRRRFYRGEEEAVAQSAKLAIAVDTSVAKRMAELYPQTGLGDKIEVVENGCEAEAFAQALSQRQADNDPPAKLVFVGALQPWTKLSLAFAALKNLPQRYSLTVIGDGPARASLEALAREAQIPVTFLGKLAHQDLTRKLVEFDIGINPDAGRDSSPLKVPEYLAAGLVVVSTGPKSLNFLRD
ncbi:MAG: glycosyltransferase family 4 protein, partial [Planctomycetes bacterium]|nr:glycosyltransferase family 4 protein [Planctomycetota bacterium]